MNLAKAVPEGMGGGEYMNAIMKKVGEAIHQNASPVFILSVAFQIWLFCWLALDINSTSVHGLYRDRLASAYLVGRNTDDEVDIEDDVNLYEICRYEDGATAPYHLVNVALNLQGSKNPNLRDRQSDFFFFSRLYTGGESTGYCDTKTMETIHPSMTLATAMAISAAAASPNMGRGTSGAMVAFLTLLNVRLGYWLPNPGVIAQIEGKRKDASINKLVTTLFGSLFGKQDEDDEPMTWRQIKSRRKMTRKYVPGYDFDKVLTDELGQIQKRRKNGGQLSPVYLPDGDIDVLAAAFKSELVGLGFSGGGIRSATINLGIVQMLHECGIFEKVDYMSTVSGGGYLGSSISTLMRSKDSPVEEEAGSQPKEVKRVKNRTYWQMFKWRIRPSAFVNELRSILNETGKWVNLSDGGHIENLAGIELLRRRCKFVIIGDGEADPNLSFNGLATLVRYARIDLGITIDIDVEPIRLDRSEGTLSSGKGALSDAHFAFGTIKYPGETEPGYLLYLKSSYTGDEDVVIQEYRYRNPDFPHESTADQSFDEGQFEAYRALGQHIAENALEAMGENAAFSAKFSDPEA